MTPSAFVGHPELENSGVRAHVGGDAGEPVMRAIGGLVPIALCDRTSLSSLRQASIFLRASSSFMNQCVFRHSVRNLPLNDSMMPLSIALPGREKWRTTPFLIRPQIEIPTGELRSLIDPDALRIALAPAGPFERRHHINAPIAEPGIHCRREPRDGINDGQNPDLPARGELVLDEVYVPGLVAARHRTTVVPQLRLDPALERLITQLQVQVSVKAIDPLRIDRPALPAQQDVLAAIPISHAGLTECFDPLAQLRRRATLRLVGI